MLRTLTKTLKGIQSEIKRFAMRHTTVGYVHALRTRIRVCGEAGSHPVDDLVKDIFLKYLGYKDANTIPFGLFIGVQEQVERAFIRGACAMEDEMQKQIDS